MTDHEKQILNQIKKDMTSAMSKLTYDMEANDTPTPYQFLNDLAKAHAQAYINEGWVTIDHDNHTIHYAHADEQFDVQILSILPLWDRKIPENSDIQWKVYSETQKFIGTAVFKGRREAPPPDAVEIPVGIVTDFTFAEPLKFYKIDIQVDGI